MTTNQNPRPSGSSLNLLATRPLGDPTRPRVGVGVSTKLQAAFGIVAALTLSATTVASLSFSRVERGLQQIAGQQVPVMADAMRLSVISGDISAAAARFISARTAEDQKVIGALIVRKRDELAAMLQRTSQPYCQSPS